MIFNNEKKIAQVIFNAGLAVKFYHAVEIVKDGKGKVPVYSVGRESYSLQPNDTQPPFAYIRQLGDARLVPGERLSSCSRIFKSRTNYRIIICNPHFDKDVHGKLEELMRLNHIEGVTVSSFMLDKKVVSVSELGEVRDGLPGLYMAVDVQISGAVMPTMFEMCNTNNCKTLENPICL